MAANKALTRARKGKRRAPTQRPAIIEIERSRRGGQRAPIRAENDRVTRFVDQIERPRLFRKQKAGIGLDRGEYLVRRLAGLQHAAELGQQGNFLRTDFRRLQRNGQPRIGFLQLMRVRTALGFHLHGIGLVLDHPEDFTLAVRSR